MFKKLILFSLIYSFLSANDTLQLEESEASYNLIPHSKYFIDKDSRLDFFQVLNTTNTKLFQTSQSELLNLGYTSEPIWIKFQISTSNQKKDEKTWFLEVGYTLLDKVILYSKDAEGKWKKEKLGDRQPFHLRPLSHRNHYFIINTTPKEVREFYLEIQSDGAIQIPLNLMQFSAILKNSQYQLLIFGLLYGGLLVMALYNLFIFFMLKEKTYLLYAIYITCASFYMASLNGLTHQFLWPGADWMSQRIIPFLISATAAGMVTFSIYFLNTQKQFRLLHYVALGLLGINLLNMFLSWVAPYSLTVRAGTLMGFLIPSYLIFLGISTFRQGYRPARFYLIAWSFTLAGTFVLALNKFGIVPRSFFTEHSYQLGTIIESILLSFALGDRIKLSNMAQLQAESFANQATRRFNSLFQNTHDLLISMTRDYHITAVNPACQKLLKAAPKRFIGKEFFEIIGNQDEKERQTKLTGNLLKARLSKLLDDGNDFVINLPFRIQNINESINMQVHFERMGEGDETEIFARAQAETEDQLSRCIGKEILEYELDNNLILAEDLANRLVTGAKKIFSQQELTQIRICLRELLINAVEHGNLGISFDEKSKALMDGSYFDLIRERRMDEQYKKRKIFVRLHLDGKKFEVTIRDHGKGFDHKKMIQGAKARMQKNEPLLHGRGMQMTLQNFDELVYNDKGNEVRVMKKIKI